MSEKERQAALQSLRERVEKADGPDRELDALITEAFEDERSLGRIYLESRRKGEYAPRGFLISYTASIDSAVALIERKFPGCEFEMTNIYGIARVSLPLNFSDTPYATATRLDGNLALALIAALLSALETRNG